ncbi:hypothetical protein IQ07DRAFT_506898 [Pyrenochaeta sp. DS3sAY3a]|nr:hypothetical protein IQ07DRAFT_506898 [Pyrenochaeta sp. DS3sAY3a]
MRIVDVIPENFKFQEFSNDGKVPYPDTISGIPLTVIHRDYRGNDRPNFTPFKLDRQPAQIIFQEQGFITGENMRQSIGLTKDVTYHIFANSILPATTTKDKAAGLTQRRDAAIDVQFWDSPMSELEKTKFLTTAARGYKDLLTLAEKNNMMRIRVGLVPHDESSKGRAYSCRPVFSGITDKELEAIRTKGRDVQTKASLSQFEQAIYYLDTACRLDIFRRMDCGQVNVLTDFKNYFLGCMFLCSAYRNFWGYQLQYETPKEHDRPSEDHYIFSSQCNLEGLIPLPWLPMVVFPSAEDCSFMLRLSLARERESQKRIIQGLETTTRGRCTARFEAIEGLSGGFIVKVSLPGASAGYHAELVKLDIDTRLKLRVGVIGDVVHHYSGSVVEAIGADDITAEEHDDWDFVAQVSGPEYDFETEDYTVDLEFIDDSTAGHHARVAIESMARQELKRTEGVDIPAVIFKTSATIAPELQNSGRDISKEELADIRKRLKTVFKLNGDQKEAVMHSFVSPTGLTLVDGPPGTGKTTTITAAAREHCRFGNKILFTCPSNKAVDAALSSFLKKRQTEPCVVRFVGDYQTYEQREKLAAPGTTGDEYDGVVDLNITATARSDPDTLFHKQLDKAISKWASNPIYDMHGAAREFRDNLAKAKSVCGKQRSEINRKLQVSHETLTKHFLKHDVDMVFTTCSSACHPTLANAFRPMAAFIDEAGQATIPDVCMALDPFKEDIKWLTMSGDHKQLMPEVTANLANEGFHLLETSILRQLVCDPNGKYDVVMLWTQYRQHPDLSAYNNAQFYDGKLIDAPLTSEGTPLSRTVRHFFSQLGAAKKNKRSVRLAIDVSSEDAQSQKYGDTTSYCNHEEANVIVELVSKLLKYKPHVAKNDEHKFGQVMPSNIGIITLYKAQQRLLQNLLRQKGYDSVEVKILTEGTGSTTRGVQGGEVDIALISLCGHTEMNPASKLRFAVRSNELRLLNSRARVFQVTTGNFKGWCESIAGPPGHGINHTAFNHFKALVKHHYEKGDIVSHSQVHAALLGEKPVNLTVSQFYSEDMPSIDPAHLRKREDKRKAGAQFPGKDNCDGKKPNKNTANIAKTPAAQQQPVPTDAPKKGTRAERRAEYQAKLHAAGGGKLSEKAKREGT